jgi:hypothetical protein
MLSKTVRNAFGGESNNSSGMPSFLAKRQNEDAICPSCLIFGERFVLIRVHSWFLIRYLPVDGCFPCCMIDTARIRHFGWRLLSLTKAHKKQELYKTGDR